MTAPSVEDVIRRLSSRAPSMRCVGASDEMIQPVDHRADAGADEAAYGRGARHQRIAPPIEPPIAAPAAPRTSVAMVGSQRWREQEGEGDAPPPGVGERFLDHAEPLVGVQEAVGPGQDPDMLCDGARFHAEQQRARQDRPRPATPRSSCAARPRPAPRAGRSRPSRGCRAGSGTARGRRPRARHPGRARGSRSRRRAGWPGRGTACPAMTARWAMTHAGSANARGCVTALLPRARHPSWRSAARRPGRGCAGEAPEIGSVRELRAAGLHPLVAARADGEAVALGDRAPLALRAGSAQRYRPSRHGPAPRCARPAFAPLVQSSVPKVNQPEVKPPRPEAVKARSRSKIDDGTRAPEDGVLQIDPAARIPERGIAGRLKGPPDRLAQHMRERAHLGDKCQPPAPDLPDGPAPASARAGRCRTSSRAIPRPRRCPSGRRGCRSR